MAVIHLRAMNLGDLYNVLQALVNRVFGFPDLRPGTVTTDYQVSAFAFSAAGQAFTKAAAQRTTAGLTNTAAGQFRKVRVQIDSAGALTEKEGGVASAQVNAPLPRRTANRTTVGWIEIPASFTYGTTAFTAGMFKNGDPDLADGVGLPPNDRGISQEINASS